MVRILTNSRVRRQLGPVSAADQCGAEGKAKQTRPLEHGAEASQSRENISNDDIVETIASKNGSLP